MPVRSIHKLANQRCVHQRTLKGCAVYRQPKFPLECRLWSCVWKKGEIPDADRPDRAHYVIDEMGDTILINKQQEVPVAQIWCDPKHPLAHRDPALRVWLDERGKQGIAALVRYDSFKAIVIFPPSMSTDGQWHEVITNNNPDLRQMHGITPNAHPDIPASEG
jgi:hypothetical protein